MDNIQEDNPSINRFWNDSPDPDEAHQFGECMEDWRDYAWRKEQEEMDCRRKVEEWESWMMRYCNLVDI